MHIKPKAAMTAKVSLIFVVESRIWTSSTAIKTGAIKTMILVIAALVLEAAEAAIIEAIIKSSRPISIRVNLYKKHLPQKFQISQITNATISTAEMVRLYKAELWPVIWSTDCEAGASVSVVRRAIKERHRTNKNNSKTTRALLFDRFEAVTLFFIFMSFDVKLKLFVQLNKYIFLAIYRKGAIWLNNYAENGSIGS